MIFAELDKKGEWVICQFDYYPEYIERIKKLPRDSRKFVSKEKGGPYWKVRLDLVIMRRLREQFNSELKLGDRLSQWGQREVERERNMISLSTADDAELVNVPKKVSSGKPCPIPWRKDNEGNVVKFKLRPYQRADIAFMAQGASINANQPGSGKTSEWVLAVIEAELEWGFNLVCAPMTALQDPWEDEIKAMYHICGLDEPTIFSGETPAQRKRAIKDAAAYAEEGNAFWLVLNPHMFRRKRELTAEGKEKVERNLDPDKNDYVKVFNHPELKDVPWDSAVCDEFHLNGLTNPDTQFADGYNSLLQYAEPSMIGDMSGTPMGGKPIKLWGALHNIAPKKFPTKWGWARQWLVVEKEVVKEDGTEATTIEGIKPGRELEFYDHLKPWFIRRTKEEILPHLPPKTRIPVWCSMTPKQKEQYEVFERDAEWRLGEAEDAGRVSATNVLAEYTRLKQFASAYCEVEKTGKLDKNDLPVIRVKQTADSGKYDRLIEKLRSHNVITDAESDAPCCAIIASQHNGVIQAVAELLEKHKVPVATITGETKQKDRTRIKQEFQAQAEGAPRVIVINTKAAGTAITLSRADSVHLLDETWNPDDQEQVEDRAHRGDSFTEAKLEVPCYYYRTKESIEEYIQDLVNGKDLTNMNVIELRKLVREHTVEQEAVAA